MLLKALPVVDRAYDEFFAPVAKEEDVLRGTLLRLFTTIRGEAE
jgi:hypothetical protein